MIRSTYLHVTGTGSTRTTIRRGDIRTSAHTDEGMDDFRRCSNERSRIASPLCRRNIPTRNDGTATWSLALQIPFRAGSNVLAGCGAHYKATNDHTVLGKVAEELYTAENYRRFTLAEVLTMAAMNMKTSRPVSGSCLRGEEGRRRLWRARLLISEMLRALHQQAFLTATCSRTLRRAGLCKTWLIAPISALGNRFQSWCGIARLQVGIVREDEPQQSLGIFQTHKAGLCRNELERHTSSQSARAG